MNEAFKEGQQVRVIKGRVPSDPIVGKTGTVVGNVGTIQPLWVICLDRKTYGKDSTDTLLYSDEIETLY